MRFSFLLCACLSLGACADRITAPLAPDALHSQNTQHLYVVTNRQRNEDGFLGPNRAAELRFLDTTVAIPASHVIGDPPTYSARPDPQKHFVIAEETAKPSLTALTDQISRDLSQAPRQNREVILFVHGFFNTYQDSLFRLAQIQNDFDVPGAVVNFAWASAGSPLGYAYDRESVLFSRDDLETTLRALVKTQDSVLLVGHSMGTLLITETLRQIELGEPGWVARNLDGLMLIAPDMPVDLFARNLERIQSLPPRTMIMTSTQDNALRLSNRVNRSGQRLGQISDPDLLADMPVLVLDVSNFSESGSTNHMTFAESPALIALMQDARELDDLLTPDDASFFARSAERVRRANDAVAIQVAPPGGGS